MTRLRQALDDLNQKGFTFSSLKQLSGGINSAVFEAKSSDGMQYALKIYPLPSSNDPRNRCRTEKNFLSYLRSCQVINTASILESNISAGWSLMSWIEGQKPTNLQPSDFRGIANFISLINEASREASRSHLEPASEACQSLSGLISSLAERLKKLQSTTPNSELSEEAIQWVTNTIDPHFRLLSQRLLNTRGACSHWQDLHNCRIASPSDAGIHNTLRTQQGLHFIDFEYAGIDDLSKLAADWILQPEYRLDQTQEEFFIKILLKGMEERIGTSWHVRLKDIKPLIHVKWCLIMLKPLRNNSLNRLQLRKIMAYFQHQD